MCGRFALKAPKAELIQQFGLIECDEFEPHYNIAPMQFTPIVRQTAQGQRTAKALRWGLLPSWAKDASMAAKLTNARAETVAEKRSFRSAYRHRRCIVPASGFFEWQALASGKQPYYLQRQDQALLALAGLWEHWLKPDGEALESFTVLTTEANDDIRAIHERMPVILSSEDVGLWLTPETHPELLHQLLQPCPAGTLDCYPVGKAVGNVRNDWAELIQPC